MVGEEDLLELGDKLILGDLGQIFDLGLLPSEVVLVKGDLTGVSIILLLEVDILLRNLGVNCLLLSVEVFVRELLDLLSQFSEEVIGGIDDKLT